MYKLDLEKVEEPDIKLQHPVDHRKSKGILKDIYFYFIHYAKAFDCVDHNKLWKNSSRDGNTRTCYLSPVKPV